MKQTLEFAELEQVYDLLAEAIDAAGPERESLFLARLVLLLSHEIPDLERVRKLIAVAAGSEAPQ